MQAQDADLEQQSQQQVRHYLDAVHSNKDLSINLWALAQVSLDRPEIRSYITAYAASEDINHPTLQILRDTTLTYAERLYRLSLAAQSAELLVAALLEEPDKNMQRQKAQQFETRIGYPKTGRVDYPRLVAAIIQQQAITEQMLPAEYFHQLHFFLFFNNDLIRSQIITADYLSTAADAWGKRGISRSHELRKTLHQMSFFRAHYILDRYNDIDSLYNPIINNPILPVSTFKLNILRMLDYSMYRLGYYNRSINITRNYSLPLVDYLDQQVLALKLQIDLGASLFGIGQIEEAQKVLKDVRLKSEENSYSVSSSRILNNLASTYWISGEFDQFLKLQFKALEAAKTEDSYDLRFDILQNFFTHYRISKDFTSAKQYLVRAQELAQKEQRNEDLAQLAYFQGQLYRDAESDLEQALASFDEALSLISFNANYESYQNILTEKSRLLEKQGKTGQAQEIYHLMQQKAQEREDPRNSIFAAFSKANTHLTLGQMNSAQIMLDTLSTKSLDALDFYQLVKAKTVQARYRKATGRPGEAVTLLQPVIDQIVQRSRSSGTLEEGFWQIEPEYLNAFENFANLLIETNQSEEAVETLDRLKTINDVALYQNPLARSKVLNEKELSDYKRLTDQLDVLRKQLLTVNDEDQPDIQQKIDERSAQKSALDRKITENANPKPVSVNYIQRRMNAYQLVLHITELNDVYYLATISRNEVHFRKVPITRDMRSRFEKTMASIAAGNTNLTDLYPVSRLLGIQDMPDHIDKLTIIPDSYLYQIPIDILPLEKPSAAFSYGDAVYLIERFQTNYMTSLNDFKAPKSNTDYDSEYTGFGVSRFDDERTALVPLPQAKAEIELISKQLTALKNRKTYINSEATEQAFRSSAPKAKILHLATHSEISGRDPMFSSIYLSRSSDDDDDDRFPGRIFAYELFELKLQNELIMLNSCESGSGSYLQGTGVVGISRALRYAGAKSLVLNLWSVNDMMASEFAVKFYDGINKGQSKSEALRNAKLHFLKTKNANPHYWGAYMLLGNEDAIVKPNSFTKNMVAASFLIFFFSLTVASSVLEIKRRRQNSA